MRYNGENIEIVVALPEFFPDELPKIYLTDKFLSYPIPHVGVKNLVCTYPTDNIDFYSEYVEGLLRLSIEQARNIITDGITGINNKDFEDEFLAYWSVASTGETIY